MHIRAHIMNKLGDIYSFLSFWYIFNSWICIAIYNFNKLDNTSNSLIF